MSVDRGSASAQQELISEAFSALARADNDEERPYIRAYVVDELVLTVTERGSAYDDGVSSARPAVGTPDAGALQRKEIVEEITGRQVTATLTARRAEPDVNVELFVLSPDGADT